MLSTIWKRVKPWCIPACLTLSVYLLMRFVFFVGFVPTASMEPTLPEKSFIFGLRIFNEPKVGDIIVFEKDGALLVKRIAAGPGDQVDLSQLPYMDTIPILVWGEPVITVPEGCYFVLGDNTQDSWDSRYWGNPWVYTDQIKATLIFNRPSNSILTRHELLCSILNILYLSRPSPLTFFCPTYII